MLNVDKGVVLALLNMDLSSSELRILAQIDELSHYKSAMPAILDGSSVYLSLETGHHEVLRRIANFDKVKAAYFDENLTEPVVAGKPKKHFEKFNKTKRHGKW